MIGSRLVSAAAPVLMISSRSDGRRAAGPVAAVGDALDRVRHAPTILAAMRLAPGVRQAVISALDHGAEPQGLLAPLLDAIGDASDTVTATAAILALGAVPGDGAEDLLRTLIDTSRPGHDAHAACSTGGPQRPGWSSRWRSPSGAAGSPACTPAGAGSLG